MSDGGKGSKQRPTNHKAYATSWDRIFGVKHSLSTQDVKAAEAAMQEPSTVTEAVSAFPATPIQALEALKQSLK